MTLPNGEVHHFSEFAIHGMTSHGPMAVVYCDLVDLCMAVEYFADFFRQGYEELTEEQQQDVSRRIEVRRDELSAAFASSEGS